MTSKKRLRSGGNGSTDVLTAAQRSYCMSQIKGRNTKPELALRSLVWRHGLRFFVRTRVTGRPDLVFPSARLAVFVDGCQWHCCRKHWVRPKSNTAFWDAKFRKTQLRDLAVNRSLKREGWRVLRFWEHDVEKNPQSVAQRIAATVRTSKLAKQTSRSVRKTRGSQEI